MSAGVGIDQIAQILPPSKTLSVEGVFVTADELWDAVTAQLGKSDENRRRWHLDDPIVVGDRTWVVNNNWGDRTREFFGELLKVAPSGFEVLEEDDDDPAQPVGASPNL